MKTIEWLLVGALLLGTAEIAKDYITSECVTVNMYVRNVPNGQVQHQEVKTERCYNDKKTNK